MMFSFGLASGSLLERWDVVYKRTFRLGEDPKLGNGVTRLESLGKATQSRRPVQQGDTSVATVKLTNRQLKWHSETRFATILGWL